jgi:hypothetical protein
MKYLPVFLKTGTNSFSVLCVQKMSTQSLPPFLDSCLRVMSSVSRRVLDSSLPLGKIGREGPI